MKLDFICIGAQKAGTTTLHDILNSHPDIYLPSTKEAHFFDNDEVYIKGLEYWFSTYFNTYAGEKFVGNINPNLQIDNKSIDRIIETLGTDVKIIFILRNPVERAFSHYLMSKMRGLEKLDFEQALKEENNRISNPKKLKGNSNSISAPDGRSPFGYIYRSQYAYTIKYLYKKFPASNIKIILFEDFISNKKSVIIDLLRFLNIPDFENLAFDTKSNVATMPKSNLLRNLLRKPSFLKKIAAKFFGERQRNVLRQKLNNLNKRELTKEEKSLSPEIKNKVFNTYFGDAYIKELENLTNLNLSKWKNL